MGCPGSRSTIRCSHSVVMHAFSGQFSKRFPRKKIGSNFRIPGHVNYVDCGTAVARTNKVNTNAHDASGIFRDVYIQILGKVCRLRDCGSRI